MKTPIVIESTKDGERAYDIYSRLLRDRIVMITGQIDEDLANAVVAQLLFLDHESQEPIELYINSNGGSVSAGLAIYDTMRTIKAPVNTVCVGRACSMAGVLLMAGKKRSIMPNSKVMLHQPLGGVEGQATDIAIAAIQIAKAKDKMLAIVSAHTGRSVEELKPLLERDFWMDAEEAKAFGAVDKIIG